MPPKIWLQASLLFLLGVLLRLPFQSHILHEWDSVQFALALDNFDIRLHQPHPPGMFVFYIFLGRLINLFIQDANSSLVCLSTIATGLATAAIFILSATWFNRKIAFTIALLMLSSPLVWFQGEVALSYMLEFSWVLLIVWSCYHLPKGNKLILFASTILIGLSGGIRPNTLFFTLPLWLVAVFIAYRARKYNLNQLFTAVILGIVSVASWYIPLIIMSGGWQEYWQAMQPWLNEHPQDGAGRSWQGIYLNFKMLLEALLYGVGFALIPTIWLFWHKGKKLLRLNQDLRKLTLLIWILPGLIYLLFIHMQRLGHSFTILPAVIIIAGWATYQVGQKMKPFKPNAPVVLPLMILLGNSWFFLFVPGRLDNVPSWQTIRDYDRHIGERVEVISQKFSPESTMIITRGRNARAREFYLPDYAGSTRTYEPGREEETLPENLRNLVLFEDKVMKKLPVDSGYKTLALPTKGEIRYFTWDKNKKVIIKKNSVKIVQKS